MNASLREEYANHASSVTMSCRNHKGLIVWQKALALAHHIHVLALGFPRTEAFGLAAQMRRSAVSIPSNIAEGAARAGTREFLRFLHVARGSFAELETQLMLACRANYMPEGHAVFSELEDVGKLINALIASLRRRLKAGESAAKKILLPATR